MSQPARATRVAVYQSAVGVGLLVYGAVTRNWWNAVIGLLLLGARVAAALSNSESLSWLRGELDERREHAVDRSYRVAFVVLALWVTALSVLSGSRSMPVPLWPVGIVVAVAVAYTRYAIILRRT
jgi:hypothetical protein